HIYGSGGAISDAWGSTVRDSSFDHNSAELGGAIFNPSVLSGCSFTGNSAIEGGGIYTTAGVTLDVRGSTFSGNTARDSGGGISNLVPATHQQCSGSSNSAGSKGVGIFNAAAGTLTVKDSSVLNNVALLGADLFNDHGIVTVNDSLIGDWYTA